MLRFIAIFCAAVVLVSAPASAKSGQGDMEAFTYEGYFDRVLVTPFEQKVQDLSNALAGGQHDEFYTISAELSEAWEDAHDRLELVNVQPDGVAACQWHESVIAVTYAPTIHSACSLMKRFSAAFNQMQDLRDVASATFKQ